MPPDNPAAIPTDADSAIARSAREAELGAGAWDIASDRIALSDQAAHLLGAAPSQPIAYVDMRGLFHPDDRAAADAEWRASQAAGGRFDFDLRTAADGRRLRVRGRFSGDNASGILLDAGRFGAALDDSVIDQALDGTVTFSRKDEASFSEEKEAKRLLSAVALQSLARRLMMHSLATRRQQYCASRRMWRAEQKNLG